MTDDQKRTFDAIYTLRSAAWNSSDARRDAEWRVALGLWTALAALTGILLGKESTVRFSAAIKYGGVALVAFLVYFHALFTHGLQEANRFDRDPANRYDDFIEREFLTTECPSLIDDEWKHLRDRRKKRLGSTIFSNYSHRFQILVTLLFGLCLIGVLLSK